MAFIVLRTRAVREAVDQMSKREPAAPITPRSMPSKVKAVPPAANALRRSEEATFRLPAIALRGLAAHDGVPPRRPDRDHLCRGAHRRSAAGRKARRDFRWPVGYRQSSLRAATTHNAPNSDARTGGLWYQDRYRRSGLGGLGRRRGVERDAKHAAVLGNHPRATHRATPRVRDLAHIHQARRGGREDAATSSTLSPARRARLATALAEAVHRRKCAELHRRRTAMLVDLVEDRKCRPPFRGPSPALARCVAHVERCAIQAADRVANTKASALVLRAISRGAQGRGPARPRGAVRLRLLARSARG